MLHVSPTYQGFFPCRRSLSKWKRHFLTSWKWTKKLSIYSTMTRTENDLSSGKPNEAAVDQWGRLVESNLVRFFHLVDRSNCWWFFCAEKDEGWLSLPALPRPLPEENIFISPSITKMLLLDSSECLTEIQDSSSRTEVLNFINLLQSLGIHQNQRKFDNFLRFHLLFIVAGCFNVQDHIAVKCEVGGAVAVCMKPLPAFLVLPSQVWQISATPWIMQFFKPGLLCRIFGPLAYFR